jgi:nitrate/nitrite-specific signal transduction histidine kinase
LTRPIESEITQKQSKSESGSESDKKRLIEEKLQQFITKRNKRLMRKLLQIWSLWCRKIKAKKLQEQREREQYEAEYRKFIQSLDTSVHSLRFVEPITNSFSVSLCSDFTSIFFHYVV